MKTVVRHLIAIITLLNYSFAQSVDYSNTPLLTINQIVSHPALNDARRGLEEALKIRNISPKRIQIRFDTANGSIPTAVQIAKYQASLTPAVMVGIATPSAQAILKARDPSKTILAFVAVTDPKAAGLADAPNVIGVSDTPPVKQLLEALLQIMPHTKTIGVVYNAGEINSVKTVNRLTEDASKLNIRVKTATITSTSDLTLATSKIVQEADVIYVPQDNLVVAALTNLISIANKSKIPVINNDPSLLSKGIFLSLGADYYQSGMELGHMIANLVEGKKNSPSIRTSAKYQLQINSKVVETMKLAIPKKFQQHIVKVLT